MGRRNVGGRELERARGALSSATERSSALLMFSKAIDLVLKSKVGDDATSRAIEDPGLARSKKNGLFLVKLLAEWLSEKFTRLLPAVALVWLDCGSSLQYNRQSGLACDRGTKPEGFYVPHASASRETEKVKQPLFSRAVQRNFNITTTLNHHRILSPKSHYRATSSIW